jgi:hypothetical protein
MLYAKEIKILKRAWDDGIVNLDKKTWTVFCLILVPLGFMVHVIMIMGEKSF